MTQYTAPQRRPLKHRLSRRARIILLASLLVPTSLFAIANVPASAAAKFTTLQEVVVSATSEQVLGRRVSNRPEE